MHGLRDRLAGDVLKIPPDKAEGRHRRRRRRIRNARLSLSRVSAHCRSRPALAAPCSMAGRPDRAFSRRRARTRQRDHRRNGARPARAGFWPSGSTSSRIWARISRSLAQYRAVARRDDGDRALQDRLAACAGAGRLHAHTSRSTPIAAQAVRKRPMSSNGSSTNARAKLGLSQETIRLSNFVPPEAMPYKTETKRTYDVGDFGAALQAVRREGRRRRFRGARRTNRKSRGRFEGSAFRAMSSARHGRPESETRSSSRRMGPSPC